MKEALEALGIAVSFDRHGFTLRITVQAESPHEATVQVMELIRTTLPATGAVMRVALEAAEDLALHPGIAKAPEFVGIAELAELLAVTKQRASELAKSAEFPLPLTVLKAGPVWTRPSVARYLSTWSRRPGRPARKTQVDRA